MRGGAVGAGRGGRGTCVSRTFLREQRARVSVSRRTAVGVRRGAGGRRATRGWAAGEALSGTGLAHGREDRAEEDAQARDVRVVVVVLVALCDGDG